MSEGSGQTATDVVAPLEVNGGDGPVTFDELEAIETQSKAAKRAERDSVKEAVKETVKTLDKSKKDDSDKDSEGDEKKKSAKKADDKEEGDEKESGKKETKSKELEKPNEKKSLKAKVGDKEIDLDPEAILTIKVNGKDEPVSIRELQRNYGGKVEWEKRFSEFDKERKVFHSKVEGASSKIKQIFEEQDPEMRLFKMAEFAGKDPVEVRSKFLSDNVKLLEKYYAMTEDERKQDALEFENKILKQQREFKQKEDAERDADLVLRRKIADLGTTHQISEDTYQARFEELKALTAQGTFKGEITPEFISETIQKDRLWNSAAEILDTADLQFDAEKRSQALLDLVETAFIQGLGPKQVREIAEEMWGKSKKTSVIEEKVNEQEELRTGKKGTKKPEYSADNDATFFGDL